MKSDSAKRVLISGASFAGLSSAYWMRNLGYDVTVVEIFNGLKKGGTPVDIREQTVDIVKRMGIVEKIKGHALHNEGMEFKNANDETEGAILREKEIAPDVGEYEIERDYLLNILFDEVKNDVKMRFNLRVTSLKEMGEEIEVEFSDGSKQNFDLVLGCDGIHSSVRKIWFGEESNYMHFLHQYFSITIINKSLVREGVSQMYNEPGKAVMVHGYNNKSDIVLCFFSENEIPYNYRDEAQQRKIIFDQFEGVGWKTPELLAEVKKSDTFYFDKLCQIKMPSWSKGRVVLVGDAGYCASPAAGMGGSLAIIGAAGLGEAMQKHGDDFAQAFKVYEANLRPFIEEVQANAKAFGLEMMVPRTEEAIRSRYSKKDW